MVVHVGACEDVSHNTHPLLDAVQVFAKPLRCVLAEATRAPLGTLFPSRAAAQQ